MAGLPVVTSLKKTCTACPSQWDGTLDDGRVLYARYRWGELSVGLGRQIDDAVDNGRSEDPLFCEHVGNGLDGFMSFEELQAHLCGLLDFPPTSEGEKQRVAVAQTSKAIAGAPWCIRFLCRLPGQKANAASEGKTTTSIWC